MFYFRIIACSFPVRAAERDNTKQITDPLPAIGPHSSGMMRESSPRIPLEGLPSSSISFTQVRICACSGVCDSDSPENTAAYIAFPGVGCSPCHKDWKDTSHLCSTRKRSPNALCLFIDPSLLPRLYNSRGAISTKSVPPSAENPVCRLEESKTRSTVSYDRNAAQACPMRGLSFPLRRCC